MLSKLRGLMKDKKLVPEPLQAYIVPSGDAHQSEYPAKCYQRRAFISGFTGSAGTVIVTENKACLWTDGRYYLQALEELDSNWTIMHEGSPKTPTLEGWLIKTLPKSSRVGVDPTLIPYTTWKTLAQKLRVEGHELIPVEKNLLDYIWSDRPPSPNSQIKPLSADYTGKTSRQKVKEVREKMVQNGATGLVLTALDEIAWLLNLRADDVMYNPVFYSYALVSMDKVLLFTDLCKMNGKVVAHFAEEDLQVETLPYEDFFVTFSKMVADAEGKIWISPNSSYAVMSMVPEEKRVEEITPVALMKAVKNDVEISGMKAAHIRDGAALCCFFAWLESEVSSGRNVTELSAAAKLEEFKRDQSLYVGPSFATISSSGPHGAIIHYSPTEASDRKITTQEVYLCDCGSQYFDGTTDVTRTFHFGEPSQHEKECYTRVFKGQYLLGSSIFPSKIKGNVLDAMARRPLWELGLEYLHGTGHGVGHYLNVHEGPMGISWRMYPDDPGLEAGMFLSNEPGYYEDEKFGVRLENIMVVVRANTPYNFKNKGFLQFETVTMVPIQTKMLDCSLLTQKEIAYLNDYHKECREKVGPLLKMQNQLQAYEWLCRETVPIG